MIDYEAQVNNESGIGVKLRARRYLEGWDFKEVASGTSPFYHKVATIDEAGKGWVDLVRGIGAVTLLGRGFGELIEPSAAWKGSICAYWDRLPRWECYLAVAAADLFTIIDEEGNPNSRPVSLCDGLFWHGPWQSTRGKCQCNITSPRKLLQSTKEIRHTELAQTILPKSKSGRISEVRRETLSLGSGAFVFGRNGKIPWTWGDYGDPEIRSAEDMESDAMEQSASSGSNSWDRPQTILSAETPEQNVLESQLLTERSSVSASTEISTLKQPPRSHQVDTVAVAPSSIHEPVTCGGLKLLPNPEAKPSTVPNLQNQPSEGEHSRLHPHRTLRQKNKGQLEEKEASVALVSWSTAPSMR